jgi:hypothetical protein
VDNLYSHDGRLAWSTHRPQRGWYLRLRSPAFPPKAHVALRALPRADPRSSEGALAFGCRTATHPAGAGPRESTDVHSYPPTPPAAPARPLPSTEVLVSPVADEPGSPATIRPMRPPLVPTASSAASTITLLSPRLDGDSSAPSASTVALNPPAVLPAPAITQFMLTPAAAAPAAVHAAAGGLLARALAALRASRPTADYSFVLAPLALSPVPSAPPPPLARFHDRTPALSFAAVGGVLELDARAAQALGVAPSFWVAVALAYLDFLEDREVWLCCSFGMRVGH